MRRATLAIGAALAVLLVAAAVALAAVSFPNDGHAGPYYTPTNSTMHGNLVAVTGASWSVNYCIQDNSSGSWGCDGTSITRTGSGDSSFSIGYGGFTCLPFLLYRTHVHNNETGGTDNKPGGGAGVSPC